MLQRIAVSSLLLLLAACTSLSVKPNIPPSASSEVRYERSSFASLPQWPQGAASESLLALRQSCVPLAKAAEWQAVCAEAQQVDAANLAAVRSFFEQRFQVWQMRDGERDNGLITGYYEPLLAGSRTQSAQTPYPVYGVPADMLIVDVTPEQRSAGTLVARRVAGNNRLQLVAGKTSAGSGEIQINLADFVIDNRTRALKGRLQGNRLLPYYTRGEILQGKGVNTAPVLAWVEDDVELFFLQVQGSGRIQLEDGSFLRIGYADQNGHPYKSIGRWLVDQKLLALSDASMQGIKGWIAANPQRKQELFNANPSYVFFRDLGPAQGGPLGALGVPLTDGYSLAIDPRYVPLGAPVYLSTTWPLDGEPQALNRLMVAQDTGGAIRGGIRGDFFFGFGTEAGMYAGKMKQRGQFWLLLPRGITPQARL